jgi:hypothetical protein
LPKLLYYFCIRGKQASNKGDFMNDLKETLTWLNLRIKELENAYRIKIEGGNQYWEYDDFCCSPDEFIKSKLADIDRVANEYYQKNKK